MGTGVLLLISFAILTYWVKVGEKFRKKGKLNRILVAFFLTVIPIVITLVFYYEDMVIDKVPYVTPKGLLIAIISIVLLMIVPIMMEVGLDRKEKEIQ